MRPSYQSVISVCQQGGLALADAGATPAARPTEMVSAASRSARRMFLGGWVTRNGDRNWGGGLRFAIGALYLCPRKSGLQRSVEPRRESAVILRLSVCKEGGSGPCASVGRRCRPPSSRGRRPLPC